MTRVDGQLFEKQNLIKNIVAFWILQNIFLHEIHSVARIFKLSTQSIQWKRLVT